MRSKGIAVREFYACGFQALIKGVKVILGEGSTFGRGPG
jgi:hypothetical protein